MTHTTTHIYDGGPTPPGHRLLLLPFVEAMTAAVVGLILLPVGWRYSLLALGVGLLVSVARLAVQASLREHLGVVRDLCSVVRVWRHTEEPNFQELARLYLSVTEPEFDKLKEAMLTEFATGLRDLANRKRSPELPSGPYYQWLFPMLEQAPHGCHVWAVSRMLSCEWDDSEAERRFLRANWALGERGAKLSRVFVVQEGGEEEVLRNPDLAFHFTEDVPEAEGWIASQRDIERQDSKLMRRIGDGFIAFDERIILIDAHSADGSARGIVSMAREDINKYREVFEQLKNLAERKLMPPSESSR